MEIVAKWMMKHTCQFHLRLFIHSLTQDLERFKRRHHFWRQGAGDPVFQSKTRVQSPSANSASRTEETSALLVLIKSEIIPIPASILTKEALGTTSKS